MLMCIFLNVSLYVFIQVKVLRSAQITCGRFLYLCLSETQIFTNVLTYHMVYGIKLNE